LIRPVGLPSQDAHTTDPGTDAALAYYESARRGFATASQNVGGSEQRLQIGDIGFRLRFAGHGLPPVLLPALSPVLSSKHGRIDVELELWDEATTGVGVPDPPWKLRDVIARGDVRSLSRGRFRVQVNAYNKVLTIWDREQRRGIVWVADAERLPYWASATPMRSTLHWALADRRRHLLHAAAIGDERAGALVVGPSGSGKSTTSLACLRDGLGFVGDDYVLAETEPSLRAISVYGTAKLHPPSVELLPGLPGQQFTTSPPTFVVDVAHARPDLMRRSAAIAVILLPRVTPGRIVLRPSGAAEALRAMAPSTILQHAGESATGMALMSALVRAVPAYILELGSDIAAVAPTVRNVLEELR
jgi:hypothetical protein